MTRRYFAVLLLLTPPACLPDETRTTPGSLTVRVVAQQSYAAGAAPTADGWSLQLEQAYLNFGRIELEGDDCEAYSEAGYSRLFDMTRSEPQKVSLTYGLGECQLGFAVLGPRWNTLLGEGVPSMLAEQFRMPPTGGGAANAVSIYLAGSARRGARTVHFTWPLRVQLNYAGCQALDSNGTPTNLSLASNQSQLFDLSMDPFAPFRAAPVTGSLAFDEIADSDADADADVTVQELSQTLALDSRLRYLVQVAGGTCSSFALCQRECDAD